MYARAKNEDDDSNKKKNKRRVAISSYNTPLSDDNNINHFIKKTMGLAEPFNTKHNRHTITGIQYVSPPPLAFVMNDWKG